MSVFAIANPSPTDVVGETIASMLAPYTDAGRYASQSVIQLRHEPLSGLPEPHKRQLRSALQRDRQPMRRV